MDSDFRNAMASAPQSRNRLEDRGGKNDEVPRRVWKAVKTGTGEVRIAEAKGGRSQSRSKKEARRKREEEAKREENSRNKKSGRRVGNLG